MSTKIVLLAVLVSVVGCRKAGPTGPSLPPAGLYFPLAAGNTWEYDLTTNIGGYDTTYLKTVVLDSGHIIDGNRWYATIDVCPEGYRSTPLWCAMFSHQSNKALAIRLGRFIGSHPILILDMPLTVGKQWAIEDVDTAYSWGGYQYFHSRFSKRYVRAVETVSTPAGMFTGFHIEDSTRYVDRVVYPNGDTSSSVYREHADEWFVQGIGLVKQIATYNWNNDYGYREVYALRRYNVRLTD